jgi:hypothetical protein
MRRADKRVKAKGGAKLPVAKSSQSNKSSRVRDLEKRLAEHSSSRRPRRNSCRRGTTS